MVSDRAPAAGPLVATGPAVPDRYRPTAVLPLWPLYLMFGLVAAWWLTGSFYLVWPLFGALLLALVAVRGAIGLPAGSVCWLLFLCLAAVSLIQLRSGTELATALLRLAFYLTALVVCAYAYTALRDGGDPARVLGPLMVFWLMLVVLGWAGVLAPRLSLATPVESILPDGLASAPYVHDLVHATTTELRGSGLSTLRPSAPFPYTNNWGSCYAMLVPCVLALLSGARRGRWRPVLLMSLPLSLPPAFLTLNRGMLVSLGIAVLFVAVRALRVGRPRLLAGVVVLAVTGLALTRLIPLGTLIAHRMATSDSTSDRLDLYGETLRRIVDAPLLGYGAPLSVDTTSAQAPVGTQGQLWLVLFSHGIPALLVFLAWFVVVLRACLRDRSPAGLWLSGVVVAALVQLPFYGLTYQNLSVLFFAAGVALALAGPAGSRSVRPAAAIPVLAGAPR